MWMDFFPDFPWDFCSNVFDFQGMHGVYFTILNHLPVPGTSKVNVKPMLRDVFR